MKTSHGKLAALAFAALLAWLLLAPMRAGEEDALVLKPGALKMSVGGSYRLSCLLYSDEPNQSLRYSVADPSVAQIAADGTVTALNPGETIIRAQASGGARAEMQVLVDGTPLTELKLNTSEVYIDKGQFSGLRVSYNSDASDARLQWVSADESVARVDAAGRIEGVGGGETYVSVISPGGKSATAKVYVNVDATAAHLSPSGLTLGVGAEVPLKASFLPEDCTDRAQLWFSSDEGVARVDAGGVLRATGVGSAYVSMRSKGGLTAGMEVIVEAAPKDIQLEPAGVTLERGDEMALQIKFLESDGSVKQDVDHLVVWSSSDESVAVVDQQGIVTALKSGKCEISAASDGMTARCRLEVQVSVREIALEQSELYLLREETAAPIQLKWSITPEDADNPTLSFASSNEQVATVDGQGLVTLTGGYGSAVITLSSPSGAQASFSVHVVTQLPEAEAVQSIPEENPEDWEFDMYGVAQPDAAYEAYADEDGLEDAYEASTEAGSQSMAEPAPQAVAAVG